MRISLFALQSFLKPDILNQLVEQKQDSCGSQKRNQIHMDLMRWLIPLSCTFQKKSVMSCTKMPVLMGMVTTYPTASLHGFSRKKITFSIYDSHCKSHLTRNKGLKVKLWMPRDIPALLTGCAFTSPFGSSPMTPTPLSQPHAILDHVW